MENTLVGEESNVYIEDIDNVICLRYKENYSEANFIKDPRFKKWLKAEIKKKGKACFLYKCKNWNTFSYIKFTEKEVKCCEHPYNQYICEYCVIIFYGHSYCCLKQGIQSDFREYLLNERYSCNTEQTDGLIECGKSLPLVFQIAFVASLFCGIFLHRRATDEDGSQYSCYMDRNTRLANIAKTFIIIFIVMYVFIFYIPLIFVHFIYLIIFFKGYKTNYD